VQGDVNSIVRKRLGTAHTVSVHSLNENHHHHHHQRDFRVIIEILRDALLSFFIMPTYSEDDLTDALVAYRNNEYTLIRKSTYTFNIPYSTLASRLTTRTSRSKSHGSQKILLTAEESALLKTLTRLSNSGCPIPLSLIRDLAEDIRFSRFYLTSAPASYSLISEQ
jgi:hypothetical protein